MNLKERCISRSVNSEARGLKRTLLLTCAVAMVLSVAVPATTFAFTPDTITADATTPAMQETPGDRNAGVGYGLAAIAAGLAVGLCALGTGFAQAKIGAAGGGALAERPELSGVMIILVAIPETAVIMGFVIAISILGKL